MEFHQLQAFVKVGETKSFSKAAKLLFLTQPTVSAHIMSLEKELKTKLFDRKGREVELTPAGRRLFSKAKILIEQKDEMLMELRRYLGTIEGKLVIYSSSIPAVYILPNIVKKLHNKYPDLIIQVIQTDSGEVISSLNEHRIEMGITGMVVQHKELEFVPFMKDRLVLIAPGNLKLKSSADDSIDLKELIGENFIMRESSSGTRANVERILNQAGFPMEKIKVVAELGSTEAIVQAVKLGLGVSIVSKMAVLDYLTNKELRIFNMRSVNAERYFYLVWRKGVTLSPNAEAFKNFLLDFSEI